MIILAHRGWWLEPREKNTMGAFARAFAGGYGVETDIRDCDGALVVSHDPPHSEGAIGLDAFLALYTQHGSPGWLALNIKSDGLQSGLRDALVKHGVEQQAFVFDMSVPDALGYLRHGFQTFTRESEYEHAPSFYEQAAGVWMDAFQSDWIETADMQRRLDAGKLVALVSPELHGRPHEQTWERWREAPAGVMICTDLPADASAFWPA